MVYHIGYDQLIMSTAAVRLLSWSGIEIIVGNFEVYLVEILTLLKPGYREMLAITPISDILNEKHRFQLQAFLPILQFTALKRVLRVVQTQESPPTGNLSLRLQSQSQRGSYSFHIIAAHQRRVIVQSASRKSGEPAP